MLRAILFDLFETLVTESGVRPAGVSSLAPALRCDREPFRREWNALRPTVVVGRVSFREALREIAARLGGHADGDLLQQLCEARIRVKAQPFEQIESGILDMLDRLRRRGLRLGVISNCFAEDVAAWPHSALASRVDCAIFSFDIGRAKPDPLIYTEAMRRLHVDAAETWFIGDGGDDELSGAARAGIRAFRATWFRKRWPHVQEVPGSLAGVEQVMSLVEKDRDT